MQRTKEIWQQIRVEEIKSQDPDYFIPIEYNLIYNDKKSTD